MELNHSLGDTYHLPKAPQDLFFDALVWANYFDSFHGVETDKPTGTGTGLEPAFTDLKGRLPKTN